jgi:hypothetical protein
MGMTRRMQHYDVPAWHPGCWSPPPARRSSWRHRLQIAQLVVSIRHARRCAT